MNRINRLIRKVFVLMITFYAGCVTSDLYRTRHEVPNGEPATTTVK